MPEFEYKLIRFRSSAYLVKCESKKAYIRSLADNRPRFRQHPGLCLMYADFSYQSSVQSVRTALRPMRSPLADFMLQYTQSEISICGMRFGDRKETWRAVVSRPQVQNMFSKARDDQPNPKKKIYRSATVIAKNFFVNPDSDVSYKTFSFGSSRLFFLKVNEDLSMSKWRFTERSFTQLHNYVESVFSQSIGTRDKIVMLQVKGKHSKKIRNVIISCLGNVRFYCCGNEYVDLMNVLCKCIAGFMCSPYFELCMESLVETTGERTKGARKY